MCGIMTQALPKPNDTWESSRVTVQVLLRVAAALVTKTSNTRRAVPSAAMLTDCAAMGATAPVQFATWCAANVPHHGQWWKAGWPAAVLVAGSAHTNARLCTDADSDFRLGVLHVDCTSVLAMVPS